MDLETVKTVALWVIIGVLVIGIVLAIVIRKVVGKVISLVVAAGLIFFAWQQRNSAINYANEVRGKACAEQPSFFGITVELPSSWCVKE